MHVFFQGVGDVNCFISIVKQRISDIYVQNWITELQQTTRGKNYCIYGIFRFQPYLNVVNISKLRFEFTRLRVSAHRLEVEAGRWHKPEKTPYENRKCKHCNVLEDEFHFLLECPVFNSLRKQYIRRYYWNRTNMIKFIELLQTDNAKTIKNLATFIFNAAKLRTELYYQ